MDNAHARDPDITITPEILKLIAKIDEFKGRWTVFDSAIQFQASAGM